MATELRNYIYIWDVASLLSEVVELASDGHFFDGFC